MTFAKSTLIHVLPTLFGIMVCAPLAMAGVTDHADLVAIDYDTGHLFSVSTENGIIQLIGDPGIDDTNFSSLELAPDGFLYTITSGLEANIYKINPSDLSDVTQFSLNISALGVVGEGSLVFAPDGRIFATNGGVGTSAVLYQIQGGTASAVGVMSGGSHDINGLGARSDGILVGLDWVTNSLILINPANANTQPLMSLPFDVGTVGGMVILEGEVGYFTTAALGADVPGSQELYRFDPFGGSAPERIGFLEPESPFDPTIAQRGFGGLAIVPEPTSLTALALGGLAALIRRRRASR